MTFLQDLSALLAARTRRVSAADPGFASIDLAAHLFAAATYLRERYGDAAMDTQPPRMATDLREALAIAMTLSSADPVAAYLGACAALLGIDTVFGADRLSTAQVLPAQTMLQPLQDQGRLALFGSVQHWIRPVNPWRTAREHREAVMPHVNIYPPRPSDQLDALGMVWDRGENPETRPVRRWDLPPMERSASFRIALCPMFCGAHPRFTVNPDGNRFTIDPTSAYSNPEALANYLTALTPQLESADVRLLVLPELSVTEHARTQLAAMLVASRCMVGIVAGSFHIWRDGHAAPLNEAVFYVPDGVAWTHHKLGYFRVTDRNIRDLGKFFAQPLPPARDARGRGDPAWQRPAFLGHAYRANRGVDLCRRDRTREHDAGHRAMQPGPCVAAIALDGNGTIRAAWRDPRAPRDQRVLCERRERLRDQPQSLGRFHPPRISDARPPRRSRGSDGPGTTRLKPLDSRAKTGSRPCGIRSRCLETKKES